MELKSESDKQGTVFVSGATGYLAGWIIKQLLETGWTVKGSVRDLKATDKVEHLQKISSQTGDRLQFVQLDLLQSDQNEWNEAVKDCTYVIHTATPVPVAIPKDENVLIKPAVEGTLKVLKACNASTAVKRMVFTSSEAAIHGGWEGKSLDNKIFNEEDWAVEASCPPYPKSKLLSERAAWDYLKTIPERKLEFVVINPAYILGPLLSKYGGDTSRTLITRLLKNDMPGLAATHFQIVDVRDVANAHVIALTNPNAPGNRYVCYTSSIWMKEIAQTLHQEFKPKGRKIPTNTVPNGLVWVVSFWDKGAENIYPRLGKEIFLSNDKIKNHFGMEFRNAKESIIDMANSIVQFDEL